MAKFYNNEIEEVCEPMERPRFKEQELDSRDYSNIVAAAAAARGAIKDFIGGSLMTIAYWMFRTSEAKSIVKPFFGGIIGATGIAAIVYGIYDWNESAIELTRYIRMRLEKKIIRNNVLEKSPQRLFFLFRKFHS